jgi:beta-lactamase class A
MLTRRRFTALALTAAAAPTVVAAPAYADATDQVPLRQLRWVLDATGRAPVPEAELRQHFTAGFLDAAGGSAGVNAALATFGPQRLVTVVADQPTVAQAKIRGPVATLLVTVRVDAAGLIGGLLFAPAPARSWSELDNRLHRLAPRISFATATLDPYGRTRLLHGVNAGTARPLGSAFKLYVLGALAHGVAAGQVRWDQPLAIRDDWKSLPSGVLQDRPAGTVLSLREYANYMISISDNTAADHLIHTLGRDAVEAEVRRFGNREAADNTPFLTTRELFTLKWYRYPTVARQYLALPRAHRTAALERLGRVPLDQIAFVPEPRLADRIEWFGSPLDICRAYAGLRRLNSQPSADALSINDGGIGLDRATFPTVWFKGGSEPGVLTLNYFAATATGTVVVASVMAHDPDRAFDEDAVAVEGLGLVRGGIELAAAGAAAS